MQKIVITPEIEADLGQDELIVFCRGLQGVTQDVKYGNNLVFSVCDKMFVSFTLPNCQKLGFKVPDDQFLAMTGMPGIKPSQYMARFKWVDVPDRKNLSPEFLQAAVETSYRTVAAKLSKKKQAELGLL